MTEEQARIRLSSANEYADYYRKELGLNVIPANTRQKKPVTNWKEFQDKAISHKQHEEWKNNNSFDREGIAIMMGNVFHHPYKKDLQFVGVDLDGEEAIRKFCDFPKGIVTLEQLSHKFLIEQHKDDLTRAHVYFYVSDKFTKIENKKKFGIEIKASGTLLFCSPSVHKSGERYEFFRNEIFTPQASDELLEHVQRIVSEGEDEHPNSEKFPLPKEDEPKLKEGVRHNTLIHWAGKIANSLYYVNDEELVFENLMHINRTKFEEPYEEKEVRRIAHDAYKFIGGRQKTEAEIRAGWEEAYHKKKDDEKEKEKGKERLVLPVNKYSAKGCISLHEAVIIKGIPFFIYYDTNLGNGKLVTRNEIEEGTRVLRPPNLEEYVHIPYEFEDIDELNGYLEKARNTKLADLYKKCREFWEMYVDQDKNILTNFTLSSIFSYFQDVFPVTHYDEGIGPNGVGKSVIGYLMSIIGYRAVRAGAISGANYYRMLGNLEPGQVIIIEDEGDDISEDPFKVKIIKLGYEYDQRIPKVNMNLKKQDLDWFYIYCYKLILAEKSMKEWKAPGLVDRTFTSQCHLGKPKHSIKDVVSTTINKSENNKKLYSELQDYRKLMLCYRLLHYRDKLPELNIPDLENRDKELTYPLLQLFSGSGPEVLGEVKECLEYFIEQRHERKRRSLDAALFTLLDELITPKCKGGYCGTITLTTSEIWAAIMEGKVIKGTGFDNMFHSEEFGPLYRNPIISRFCDKFSADMQHNRDGNVLVFDAKVFDSYRGMYSAGETKFRLQL